MGAILGHTIDARRPGENAPFTIHLADVFAPARGQQWHSEAVAALNDLVKGKRGRLRIYKWLAPPEDAPEYGVAVIGRLYVDRKDLSWELVGSRMGLGIQEQRSGAREASGLGTRSRQRTLGSSRVGKRAAMEFMAKRMRSLIQHREGATSN